MQNCELDIHKIISKKEENGQRRLDCPICMCINGEVESPYLVIDDNWNGYGPLSITPINSHCGSKWEICVGSHKGDVTIFSRVKQSCKPKP